MAARAMLRSSSLLRSGSGSFLQQPQQHSLRIASRTAFQQSQRRTLFTRKTPAQKFKNRAWTAAGLVLGGLLAVYAYDSSAGIHRCGFPHIARGRSFWLMFMDCV